MLPLYIQPLQRSPESRMLVAKKNSWRLSGYIVYSVSQKKSPPRVFWKFFPNGWEFLINFLHTYYAIIYTLDYEFLFKYLQLWQSYAILSATT